jgi:hypothetical protein
MIEDGRDLAFVLTLKYLLRTLEHKGVMSHSEIQRMLDEALGEVKDCGRKWPLHRRRGRDHTDRRALFARLKGASRKLPQSLRAVAVTPSVD